MEANTQKYEEKGIFSRTALTCAWHSGVLAARKHYIQAPGAWM